MDLRDSIYPKLASEGFSHIEDPQVMSFKIPELAKFLEERNIPFFGHAGVGILHPCFREGQEGFIESMLNFVKKVNGQISGEHGIGLAKKKFVEENDKKLYRRIKKRFDPENKINPGKMLDIEEQEEKKEEKQEEKNEPNIA
jgi:glycolate oxidase